MADLLLVLFLYAVMLGVGPCVATVVEHRTARALHRQQTALRGALEHDPSVLFLPRADNIIEFDVMEDGLVLHMRERILASGQMGLRVHVRPEDWLPLAPCYLGPSSRAAKPFGDRRPALEEPIDAGERHVHCPEPEPIMALWLDPWVRESLRCLLDTPLGVFRVYWREGRGLVVDSAGKVDVDLVRLLRRQIRELYGACASHLESSSAHSAQTVSAWQPVDDDLWGWLPTPEGPAARNT